MNHQQSTKKILGALISCSLMLGMQETAAAEQEFDFDEYVVTANRIPVKQVETAASVTVITREEIERGGYTRVQELLEKSNVGIYDSGSADYCISSVYINGDSRVLIMVDGRRVNADSHGIGGGGLGVDLGLLPSVKSIERVEIVRGPASSLYGSDAAGGVINIITRKADKTDTRFLTQSGSWGMKNYTLTTEGSENGFGYFISAERKRQDYFEYKDSKTDTVRRMGNSALKKDAVSVRLDKELGEGQGLTLSYRYIDGDRGYFLMAPDYGNGFYHPTAYEEHRNEDTDLTYRWKNKAGTDGSLKAYYSSDKSDVHRYMEGTRWEVKDYYVNSRSSGIEWQDNWKISDHYDIVGGASWRQVKVDIPHLQVYDKEITNKAIFLENRWQLPKAWTLTAGMRYDEHSAFGGKNTVRLAVNRKINEDTNAFASWGQFFKAPNIESLYKVGLPSGNPDLRPEKGDTFTIGMNTKLANDIRLQASVFSSNVEDAITSTIYSPAAPNDYKLINASKQKRRGLDFTLTQQLSPAWKLSTGYSYVKIQSKSSATAAYVSDAGNTQPNGYRLNLEYSQDKWDAGLMLRGATGRALSTFTSSSYWVVDLAANYKISDDLKVYCKGYNLTNQAYELKGVVNAAGQFPMAARHFYLGLEQRL